MQSKLSQWTIFTFMASVFISGRNESVTAQTTCETPRSEPGYCLFYKKCENYLEYLRTQLDYDELRSFLHQSHCNKNEIENIHICCDESYITPDAFYGESEYVSRLDQRGLKILSSLKDCGNASDSRISFGEDAKLEQFPWMALIEYDKLDKPYACGGTLISDRYVLTAAHCLVVDDQITGVILGEHNLDTQPDCEQRRRREYCSPPSERFAIAEIIPHPDYRKHYIGNDVGLIRLQTVVAFKKHITPICLPLTPLTLERQESYVIAGWGTTETGATSGVLKKAYVAFQEIDVCRNIFRRLSKHINEQHLCIGGDGPTDSCKGDSGGPLFNAAKYLPLKARYVQYGIVSFGGVDCSKPEKRPGIYANVTEFMPWITSNIKE